MAEQIDVFDGNHQHIGVLERSVVHQQGLWHQTFHCWITGEIDGEAFVLLQLRSPEKKSYPNMLDITAAGHLMAGEPPEAGIREVQEELGIQIEQRSMRFLGIKHDIADEPNGLKNREFAHVFMLRDDRRMSDYRLQQSEVSGLVCVPIADGLSLFSGERSSITCKAVRLTDKGMEQTSRNVAVSDMIPRVDSYYLKIFCLAQRLITGDNYLSI